MIRIFFIAAFFRPLLTDISQKQARSTAPIAETLPSRWSVQPICGTRHKHSVLDERLQPDQCVIPLLGNEIEVLSHLCDRCGIEFEYALPTGMGAMHDSDALQDSKML